MDATPPIPGPTPATIARALNEQGFLFQNRIVGLAWDERDASKWHPEAFEYPVSIGLFHDETRIDLVLRCTVPATSAWYITVEAKRSHPDYKAWVFFERRSRLLGLEKSEFSFQAADYQRPDPRKFYDGLPPLQSRVMRIGNATEIPVFAYYVEARENQKNKQSSNSATTKIEEAFLQVTLGVIGLSGVLRGCRQQPFRIVPVVVTTAEIFAADYLAEDVDQRKGMIDPAKLKLQSLPWVAVNYAINDKIAGERANAAPPEGLLTADLGGRLLRTVFVVQAESFMELLTKLRVEFAEKNPQA